MSRKSAAFFNTDKSINISFVDSLVARYSGNTAEQNAIQTAVSSAAGGSGFRFRVSNGGGSSGRTNTVDFLRDKAIFNTDVGIGISPSYKLHILGGKTIISSGDNSYGQFQIGNSTSATTSEAAMAFISGVTAFGGSPTSANGNNYAWVLGTGIFGTGGTMFGLGNKGYANPILTVTSGGKVAIGYTINAATTQLGVYSAGSTFTNPINNDVACISVVNSNNSSGSAHAVLSLRSGGSSGGDAFISIDIANEDGWSMGCDNSDGNKFKIANNWAALDGSTRFTMLTTGAATFSSSVTATSFFESSDIRLKSNIQDYKSNDILNISAKIYEKDGKIEVGYLAQDLQSVLKSAVSVRDNGYLDLSYRQVHTAKIAALENEIRELKAKING
ncbi:MAG: tail fiber domain-containing protein [Dolichospermum sp.]